MRLASDVLSAFHLFFYALYQTLEKDNTMLYCLSDEALVSDMIC